MEDSQKEIFSQVQENLREIIQELYAEQKSRLGDLTQWGEKQLIITGQIFEFWCVDALVRLIRLPDDKPFDVWKVYDWVEEIAAKLTLNELTECYLQTRDAKSVIALTCVRIDVEAIQKEIQRRFKSLEMGTVFSYLVDNELSESAVASVLNITGENIHGLSRKMGWSLSPGAKDMLRALKEKKYASKKEDYKNLKNDALSTILDFYSQLQRAIELGKLDTIPFSTVDIFRPVNNPIWEKKAPLMLKEIIEDVTQKRLPILDGSMEKAPFKVYDSHRTEDRKGFITYKHQRVCKKCGELQFDNSPSCPDCGGVWVSMKVRPRFVNPSNENEDSEGLSSDRFDRITLEYNKSVQMEQYEKIKEELYQEEIKEKQGINQFSKKEEIIEWIKANLRKKTKTNKKVIKVFELILLEGKTEQEALRKAKLPDRTWRDYKKNISLKLKL